MRLNIPNQQNLNYSAHTHTKHIQNTHYNQSGKKTSILFETVNSEHEITTKKHLKKNRRKKSIRKTTTKNTIQSIIESTYQSNNSCIYHNQPKKIYLQFEYMNKSTRG